MSAPRILGAYENDPLDARAKTELVLAVDVPCSAAVDGQIARVEVYKSTDSEDRGGYVLRFRMLCVQGGWSPVATHGKDGAEIHFCGDAEADAFLTALRSALGALGK